MADLQQQHWPTKGEVNRAGRVLIEPPVSPEAAAAALDIVGHWRAAHQAPVAAFRSILEEKARAVDAALFMRAVYGDDLAQARKQRSSK